VKLVARCPCCDGARSTPFYSLAAVPTNSCLQVATREAAIAFPTAPLELCWCESCGFVFNSAWMPERTVYSGDYEETQGFSGTFQGFQHRLAHDLVERHDLRGKRIVEIGCGKGEFLELLCTTGGNDGLGFDPAVRVERLDAGASGRVKVVADYFGEHSGRLLCDFLACKMTLEHIPDVAKFLGIIRRALADSQGAVVFFQVPDVEKILEDAAFYDVYYEHTSYFSAASLSAAFRRAGFEVLKTWTDYDGQYLMIEARLANTPIASVDDVADRNALRRRIAAFASSSKAAIERWRSKLDDATAGNRCVVLWGAGSKAVSFLTAVDRHEAVTAVADINPYRQGRFMPVTGHQIVSPDDVAALDPDLVIIMNPVYRNEISADLLKRNCAPEIVTL
jgi:hypothetical protein